MEPPRRNLAEVKKVIMSAHESTTLEEKLQFYDRWALEYEQDVEVLEYRAPYLAAECLASVFPADRDSQTILDVACGTGLVAVELYRHGFCIFHGVDGSERMLQHAEQKRLYQELKLNILGYEPLAAPTDRYDAVITVGALSIGQVPLSVMPELCRVTKPGGFLCLTTRTNHSNLQYKSELEKRLQDLEGTGLWERVTVLEVQKWEKATSMEEASPDSDFISGAVYLYRKKVASACVL
nr:methyltransferase-like protein 27 isoform X2 [Geotrypetes seraphini]XP_033778098.1 methyltransferase-like protein 27 isoform X2 [Geotrypetes seraphini]XP_033778100.1 methyltransferase-like protein 27 isoform X2 [Geotrypetes seraphini]XP_033778101.1 methyltransferase-like protein 27 isoform X2 [Geotrypetes seraphini]XP_033778102.1 methyltransferase-like protein 27 isoform X2 [Geotrypetes seraphini]